MRLRPYEDPPGEVNFPDGTTYGSVSGRNIVITVPAGKREIMTYTAIYTGVTAPHRADTYGFPLTNATHDSFPPNDGQRDRP